ncbi:hypothetical protein PUN28_012783 [Cardiocondyla obscurior]|uniref:Uncharacterized protein n=1 Tax=Cardiocondyla obscurior TaxID=286306 RepID=A0AAW2FAM4_9HYME
MAPLSRRLRHFVEYISTRDIYLSSSQHVSPSRSSRSLTFSRFVDDKTIKTPYLPFDVHFLPGNNVNFSEPFFFSRYFFKLKEKPMNGRLGKTASICTGSQAKLA